MFPISRAVIFFLASASIALAADDQRSARVKSEDTGGVRVTEVRNWSTIDTDKDGYISAEEMERYLAQAWERSKGGTATRDDKKNNR